MSPEANAILQRLKRIDPSELSGCLQELIGKDEALENAAEIIEERVKSGTHVLQDDLVRLLVRVRRSSLYELVKDQLFRNQWALLGLYRGEYPDPAIENELVELLYQKAEDDADPARRDIAEAIRDKGTVDTIPVLEAILYDLAPTQNTKKAMANALFDASGDNLDSLLAGIVAKSRREFVQLIRQALDAVRERDSHQAVIPFEGDDSSLIETGLVENAHQELERARDKTQSDPIYVVVCLRRGAEAMCKHLYRKLGLEDKGKPAKKMVMEDLLKPVRESDVPDVFKICIQALQPFGNYASHDQDDQFQDLTPKVAQSLLDIYGEALSIYEDWLRRTTLQ